jgi:hypothetical protein
LDVRRFVDDGKGRELVFSPANFTGTFHTTTALKNWANTLALVNPLKVKVRGIFELDAALDFTGLLFPIELIGDGAVFNVTSSKGILVENQIAIRDITFNYDHSEVISFISGDKINSANGCIYGTGSISNVEISNCIFNTPASPTNGLQRPPFISFEIDNGDVINGLTINDNQFADNNAETEIRPFQAAIAISNLNTVVTAEPAVLYSVRIDNNTCNKYQGIYLLQEALQQISATASIDGPGINAFDTVISGNNCGAIGFLTTSTASTASVVTTAGRSSGIIIRDNAAIIIAHMYNHVFATATTPGTQAFGRFTPDTPYSLGSADIVGNKCGIIYVACNEVVANNTVCKILIDKNRIAPVDFNSLLGEWSGSATLGSATSQIAGISVTLTQDDNGDAIISNNIITAGLGGENCTAGIVSNVSSTIVNNNIRGITDDSLVGTSSGISASGVGSIDTRHIITGNSIFREPTKTITHFIHLAIATLTGTGGIVTDNFFNSPFVDSGDTLDETINGLGTAPTHTALAASWIVEKNKNQTVTIKLAPSDGNFLGPFNSIVGTPDNTHESYIEPGVDGFLSTTSSQTIFWLSDQNVNQEFYWVIPAKTCLPMWVTIINWSVDISSSNPDVQDLARLFINDANNFNEETTGDSNPDGGAALSLTPTHSFATFQVTPDSKINMNLLWRARKSGIGVEFANVDEGQITYRW